MTTSPRRRPRNSRVNPVAVFVEVEQETRDHAFAIAGQLDMSLAGFVELMLQGTQIVDGKPVLTWRDPQQGALPLAG